MPQKRKGRASNLKKPDKERKVRSDKKIRIAPSFDSETFGYIAKLAASCSAGGQECSWSRVVELGTKSILSSPEFVKWIQELHKTPDEYRIIPYFDLGKMIYKPLGSQS